MRSLTRSLQEDSDRILGFNDWEHPPTFRRRVADGIAAGAARFGYEVVKKVPYQAELRERGHDWPARAESMIGLQRMANIRMTVESVLADGVPGDLVETGVWRGGACIFMRGVLKAHDVTDRTVWACDSFKGLPAPNAALYPADATDNHHEYPALAAGLEQVKHNFRRYGLLDDQVRFLEGWFADTLPTAPIDTIAVLRLDGDMYESTMQAIEPLYPKLSPGGYRIIDDFHLPNCRAAVEAYRARLGIDDELVRVDESAVYWRKSADTGA
jgi:O-methyltransferase